MAERNRPSSLLAPRARIRRKARLARIDVLLLRLAAAHDPLITEEAVAWAWQVVEHLTKRMLYQASVYVHDNEFDALRQKAIRQLRNYCGEMTHGQLLRNMHIDSDTMRRVVETLV